VNIQQPVNSPNMPIPTSYAMTNPYQSPSNNQLNFGETTVLNSAPIGETTVLGVGIEQKSNPFLIRKKNNEKIYLNKPVFRLGKEKGYVDYFIGDNSAISRSHANIVLKEGKCFLIDTNSTNHTFLNGQIINSNVEAELNHGMRIRLANEEFEFNLY
jgi:pSer/pThr/pTyr-binding forkhead associated (FHA) protein